jgi:hypothetical protein
MTPYYHDQVRAMLIIAAVCGLAVAIMLLCGCAVIKVDVRKDGSWNGRAYTLFKTLEVPPFIIGGSNGQFEAMGIYKSGTDIDKAGAVIGAAVKAAGYGK